MRKIALVLTLQLILAMSASGQDLGKLPMRAKQFLSLRVASNKTDAARYVEASKRRQFLEQTALSMSDAQLIGLEFTEDVKVMYVTFKATLMIPNVGPFPVTIREPWVWDGKDWFLRIEDIGNPFDGTRNAAPRPAAKPLPFELSVNAIDLGKHAQGEQVKRTLDFKSNRDEFFMLRPKDAPGLLISGPVWTSQESGQIELLLDTTLLSNDVHYSVELEALNWERSKTNVKFDLSAQIEPRLAFTQIPEALDPFKTGSAEVRVQNLSKITLKPLSLTVTNSVYHITSDVPETLAPGETLKLVVSYNAQTNPSGAAINFKFSEPVLGKSAFTLPLQIKLPVVLGPTYTREELEEITRRAKD